MVRPKKRDFRIFVEGGGDGNEPLRTACRQGFAALLEKAGLAGRLPRVVPCGSRKDAYDDFCSALAQAAEGDIHVLLVDSEAPAAIDASPWTHLLHRPADGWARPEGASDHHCHLMTECMETWLVADREMFGKFFGNGFKAGQLPARTGAALEQEPKAQLYAAIAAATSTCKTKGQYGKGQHSFAILALVDPSVVRQLPWADRFFAHLLRVA